MRREPLIGNQRVRLTKRRERKREEINLERRPGGRVSGMLYKERWEVSGRDVIGGGR